jgi:predicted AAA+ superfamily ATPase
MLDKKIVLLGGPRQVGKTTLSPDTIKRWITLLENLYCLFVVERDRLCK